MVQEANQKSQVFFVFKTKFFNMQILMYIYFRISPFYDPNKSYSKNVLLDEVTIFPRSENSRIQIINGFYNMIKNGKEQFKHHFCIIFFCSFYSVIVYSYSSSTDFWIISSQRDFAQGFKSIVVQIQKFSFYLLNHHSTGNCFYVCYFHL